MVDCLNIVQDSGDYMSVVVGILVSIVGSVLLRSCTGLFVVCQVFVRLLFFVVIMMVDDCLDVRIIVENVGIV